MRRAGLCLVVVTMLVAARVEAQPALTAAKPVEVAPPAKPSSATKDPSTATALAIVGPALAIGLGVGMARDGARDGLGPALVVGGLILGPAPGLWYAGHGGGLGMMARGTTAVLAISLLISIDEADYDDCISVQPDCDPDAEYDEYRRELLISKGLLVLTTAAYIASWVYDVRESGRVADRWNRAHGLSLAPAVISTATGRSPGVMLGARF